MYYAKSWLTGLGGSITAVGGGMTIGGAFATYNSDNSDKLIFGALGGGLTAVGGILTIIGVVEQINFDKAGCHVKPADDGVFHPLHVQ